jgi:hypothetical protein
MAMKDILNLMNIRKPENIRTNTQHKNTLFE